MMSYSAPTRDQFQAIAHYAGAKQLDTATTSVAASTVPPDRRSLQAAAVRAGADALHRRRLGAHEGAECERSHQEAPRPLPRVRLAFRSGVTDHCRELFTCFQSTSNDQREALKALLNHEVATSRVSNFLFLDSKIISIIDLAPHVVGAASCASQCARGRHSGRRRLLQVRAVRQ